MVKVLLIILGVIQIVLWLGFLVSQYYALKNCRYKTAAICCTAVCISIISCVAMLWYGDFITIAQTGVISPESEKPTIGCLLCSAHSGYTVWCFAGGIFMFANPLVL